MKRKTTHRPDKASSNVELPLYDLYKTIKELDEQTGHKTVDTESYLTLLMTFRRGYMLMSRPGLLLLCEKLWIKPYHLQSSVLNSAILRQHFVKAFGELNEEQAPPSLAGPMPPKMRAKKKRPSSNDRQVPPTNVSLPATEVEKQINRQQGILSLAVKRITNGVQKAFDQSRLSDQFIDRRFLVKGTYLPIQSRRIEQSIRLYRERLKGQGKKEIDWQATTREMSRLGYFNGFSLQDTDTFRTRFDLMIDDSPSMAAFAAYCNSIVAAVANAASAEDQRYEYQDLYYFHNCPEEHLYTDRLQTDSIRVDQFALRQKRSILIISDAGAARGSFNRERNKTTIRFLRKLKQHRVAWINPMPRVRWTNTSAEMIASYVDMFDIGEGGVDELANIVRLFKSKIRTSKI